MNFALENQLVLSQPGYQLFRDTSNVIRPLPNILLVKEVQKVHYELENLVTTDENGITPAINKGLKWEAVGTCYDDP